MTPREHRHRVEERSCRGFVDQVGAHDDQRALDPPDRAEREIVVAVDERGFRVENGTNHGFATGAPGCEPPSHFRVVDRHATPVAELVGHVRNHRDRIDGSIEPRDALRLDVLALA